MRCPESHYELQSDAHCATRYSNKHLGPILDMNGYGGEGGLWGEGLLVGYSKAWDGRPQHRVVCALVEQQNALNIRIIRLVKPCTGIAGCNARSAMGWRAQKLVGDLKNLICVILQISTYKITRYEICGKIGIISFEGE